MPRARVSTRRRFTRDVTARKREGGIGGGVKAGKSAKRLAFAFTAAVLISTISDTASAVFKIALVALVLFMAYRHDNAETMDDTMENKQ